MTDRYFDTVGTDKYQADRTGAVGLEELQPTENFVVRRGLSAPEALIAMGSHLAPGFVIQEAVRIKKVDEHSRLFRAKGVFKIKVDFLSEEGDIAGKTSYFVNQEGIICRRFSPQTERGYFIPLAFREVLESRE